MNIYLCPNIVYLENQHQLMVTSDNEGDNEWGPSGTQDYNLVRGENSIGSDFEWDWNDFPVNT